MLPATPGVLLLKNHLDIWLPFFIGYVLDSSWNISVSVSKGTVSNIIELDGDVWLILKETFVIFGCPWFPPLCP